MNHGNWLCCHISNPSAQGLTAECVTAGRSSLLKGCTVGCPGDGPVSWTAPAGSRSFLPWRMEEDHSRRQEGMKMSCLKYQSPAITAQLRIFSIHLSNVSSPLSLCHLSLATCYANGFIFAHRPLLTDDHLNTWQTSSARSRGVRWALGGCIFLPHHAWKRSNCDSLRENEDANSPSLNY